MSEDRFRRNFLAAGAALAAGVVGGLSGCANSTFGKTLNAYWQQGAGGYLFNEEQVNALPYATLAASVGGAPRAMLVLARVEGHDLHWIAADKGVLVTRYGRLVKTVGLAAGDLAGMTMMDEDPLSTETWDQPVSWRRTIDYRGSREFGVLLLAQWQPEEQEEVHTFFGPRTGLRVRETCSMRDGGGQFENLFWLALDTGTVFASVQQYHPDAANIYTEVLKPYKA